MLIDEASICVAAGNGGDGKVAFYNNRGKPCGGDGAMGASVYARVKPSLTSLISYIEKKEHKGLPGGPGESFNRYGKKPEDLILYFPKGTQLTDVDTGEIIHLDSYDQDVLLCRGGKGGWGNTTINRKQNHIFSKAMTGQKGQMRRFQVYMKLIADCGLIGFPNAGKSSLLNALTRAQARVADYPFTTLEPNLGVLTIPRGDRIILADIPGLIEGASQGKGLGVKFLKHVEKVRVFLHCISCQSDDPLTDYTHIREELKMYSAPLLTKKEIVVITKSDIFADDPRRLHEITALFGEKGIKTCITSIADESSLLKLVEMISELMIEDQA